MVQTSEEASVIVLGNEGLFQYINEFILKKDEELDRDTLTDVTSPLADISVMKRTARTLRKVGILSLALLRDCNLHDETLVPDAQLLQWTPGKRAILADEDQAFDWLSKGWIIKELRLKRDGKTVERVHYRMGYLLYIYLQKQAAEVQQEQESWLKTYHAEIKSVLEKWNSVQNQLHDRAALLSPLISHVSASLQWTNEELRQSDALSSSWGMPKRMRFLQFVLAFLSISIHQEVFDWKEIGAQYLGDIGGSKAFDRDKDEFLHALEQWSTQPAAMFGLISPGQITPFYFAGHLSGQWSSYQPGPVHALTDLSIGQDQYRTNASTLWLVENRGILTRIAAERDFVKESGLFIACVDGHIRSSHRRLIHQLLRNSRIVQVLLWSDYDEDGLLISREMMDIVTAREHLTIKWITHDHRVVTSWLTYQSYMTDLLQKTRLEQEQVLGDAEEWRRWINL